MPVCSTPFLGHVGGRCTVRHTIFILSHSPGASTDGAECFLLRTSGIPFASFLSGIADMSEPHLKPSCLFNPSKYFFLANCICVITYAIIPCQIMNMHKLRVCKEPTQVQASNRARRRAQPHMGHSPFTMGGDAVSTQDSAS